MQPQPHSVLLDYKTFQELPTEDVVAEWFADQLFLEEAVGLLGKVTGLDIEEREKRILVQLSSTQDVEQLLTRMGDDGVEWPKFLDPINNQLIRIKGFFPDQRSLRVTLLDVPRDVSDETIRITMEWYRRVEEVKRHHLAKQGMEHITVNRVSVKLVKEEEVELPTTIFGLGSSTSGADLSTWRVTYPGAPERCYHCGFANHFARECTRQPITKNQVEKLPTVGEPATEQQEQQLFPSFPRSFAVVVKSAKFVEEAAEQGGKAEDEKAAKQAKKELEDQKRKMREKSEKKRRRERCSKGRRKKMLKRLPTLQN